ncbi:MAG: hypothetical protein ACJ790_00495 [Myxococcaceae bacterium]
MRQFILLASAALLLSACGGKTDNKDGGTTDTDAGCDLSAGDSFASGKYRDADGGTTQSVEWEQQCSAPPTPLKTGQGVGGLCTIAERCKQTECTCASNGNKRYAARGCDDGFCTDPATSCQWALEGEPRLCQ